MRIISLLLLLFLVGCGYHSPGGSDDWVGEEGSAIDINQKRRPLGKDDRGWFVIDVDFIRHTRTGLGGGERSLDAVESDDPHGIVESSLQDPQDLGLELGLCGHIGADALVFVEDDESSVLIDPRAGDEADHSVGRALLVLFFDLDRGLRLDLASVPVVELGWIDLDQVGVLFEHAGPRFRIALVHQGSGFVGSCRCRLLGAQGRGGEDQEQQRTEDPFHSEGEAPSPSCLRNGRVTAVILSWHDGFSPGDCISHQDRKPGKAAPPRFRYRLGVERPFSWSFGLRMNGGNRTALAMTVYAADSRLPSRRSTAHIDD